MDIATLILDGVGILIVGGLAVWFWRVQGERLAIKDERIELVEQQRDEARAINEDRVKLATSQREDAEKQLREALESRDLGEEISTTGFSELDQDSKDLLRALLDRLQGLDQLVPSPDDARSLALKGSANRAAGEYERAISAYTRSIQVDPDYVNYNNRGVAFYRIGDYDRAIADFDQAIQLDPRQDVILNNRGRAYSRKGEHDWAIQAYDQAIILTPSRSIAYSGRALAHALKGNVHEARQDAIKAIEIESEGIAADDLSGDRYASRSVTHAVLGNQAEAQRDLDRAVELGIDVTFVKQYIEQLNRQREST